MNDALDPTERFSDRVAHYIRYRPDYPKGVVTHIIERCGLDKTSVIADIGSGPGHFARLFLELDYRVIGVEPNPEMRQAGETLLRDFSKFISVDGRAEATYLLDHSVDTITAAQAFHWFDRPATQIEFRRILKPGGSIALIWNNRRVSSGFGHEYERFLELYSTDYLDIRSFEATADGILMDFFAPNDYELRTFDQVQYFDLPSLIGRYLSSSYSLKEDDPRWREAIDRLTEIFHSQQKDGRVEMAYDTEVFIGRLTKG